MSNTKIDDLVAELSRMAKPEDKVAHLLQFYTQNQDEYQNRIEELSRLLEPENRARFGALARAVSLPASGFERLAWERRLVAAAKQANKRRERE